jgi:hypothetical protein
VSIFCWFRNPSSDRSSTLYALAVRLFQRGPAHEYPPGSGCSPTSSRLPNDNAYAVATHCRSLLTDEHVPPEKLGGRRVLLTCERCNSGSGTNFDSHAVREAAFRQFVSDEGGGPMRANIFAGDAFIRGEVYRQGNTGVFMVGVPKRNDPAAMDAHVEALDAMTQDGGREPEFGFTITENFLPERAKVEKILPALTSYDAKAPSSRRQIHLAHEPTDVRCVLVSMGQHGVFLPGVGNPLSCVELSEAISRRVGDSQGMLNIHFDHVQQVPWPSWPTYIWDREIQRRRAEQ